MYFSMAEKLPRDKVVVKGLVQVIIKKHHSLFGKVIIIMTGNEKSSLFQ